MGLDIPPKLTYEDLLDFPQDGKRYEIIGGELFVAASPSVAHQRLLLRIYHVFFQTLQVKTGVRSSSLHCVVAPDLILDPAERFDNVIH